MKNKIEDLRDHLFAAIEALQDPEKPMEIERAKAIAEVAQVIVNSAKVEVDYLRVTDNVKGSGFIRNDDEREKPALPGAAAPRLVGKGGA